MPVSLARTEAGLHARTEVVDGGEIAQMMQGTVHGATHGDDAARRGRRLRRMQRAADDGTGTIGADEQVALGDVAVRQAQRDALAGRP